MSKNQNKKHEKKFVNQAVVCVWIFTHASNSSVFHLNTICHHLKHIVWAYRANRTNNDKGTTIVVGFLTSLSYVIAVVDRCCYRRRRRRRHCRHRHRHHCFCGCYMYNFDVCFILCLVYCFVYFMYFIVYFSSPQSICLWLVN